MKVNVLHAGLASPVVEGSLHLVVYATLIEAGLLQLVLTAEQAIPQFLHLEDNAQHRETILVNSLE